MVGTATAELLILGSGDKIEFLQPDLRAVLATHGVAVEVQDTRRASATYNFLSEEGRLVAAALLPPSDDRPVGARARR